MTKHGIKWLRWIGLTVVVSMTAVAGVYLLTGRDLKMSDRKASHQYIGAWNEAANKPFDDPFAITVDASNGNVLVTDARNQRVVIFSNEGKYVRQFGTEGAGSGQFERPTGIAISPDGELLHVADSGNHRVVMLDRDGRFVTEWKLVEPGREYSPTMVAASPDGNRLYATDTAGDRIIILKIIKTL